MVYGLIAPGLAQNKVAEGTGDGASTLVQLSADKDKDVGTVSLSVPAVAAGQVPPEQQAAGALNNNTKHDLLFDITSDFLGRPTAGQTATGLFSGMTGQPYKPESPFARDIFPIFANVNVAAASGQAGDGNTAGSTDDQTAGEADAPGSSRYIVVFNDSSPAVLQMAKEQVKGFAESQDGKVIHDYSIIGGLAVTVPDDKVSELSSLADVKYVEKDQLAQADLDRAVPQIGANQVLDLGYDGSGVKVCVIDTGIDASHPDLDNGKVVNWVDYVQHRPTAYDDNGHGTHVSSTIAGTGSASGGQYRGVAPGASLMVAKALDSSGSGRYTDIIAAIDWAVANQARVISMSLGGSHSQAMDDTVNNSVNNSVVVVVSAGNSGPSYRTIGCPGDALNAITVGAVDRNDVIASFSSRGPANGSIKPDVTNMGVGLVAARASGTGIGSPVSAYYTSVSGTSMACPMTSGVVALLLEKNFSLTPAEVKDALTKTAKPLGSGTPNNDYGYGRVQAKAAFDYVLSGIAPSAPAPAPTPLPMAYGPPSVQWSQNYSQNAIDFGISGVQTADGGYVATGYSYQHGSADVYLVKTDANGHVVWKDTYGGSMDDVGYCVNQTADGGYVIAGLTESTDGNNSSVYLLKTDAAGTMQWNRTYTFIGFDMGAAVLQTSDGGYVVAGIGYNLTADTLIFLFKTDASGALSWNRTLCPIYVSSKVTLQPTADGGYILGGMYVQSPVIYPNSSIYAKVVKTDGTGNLQWEHTYQIGGQDTYGRSAQQTADGGYILTGSTYSNYSSCIYLLKTNSSGSPLWNRTYNDSGSAYGYDVRQTRDGGFVVTGVNYGALDYYQSLYLLKTDGSGNIAWQNNYTIDGSMICEGISVRQTADDGYVACGISLNIFGSSLDADLILLKTNASGGQQWILSCGEKCIQTCSWAQQTDDGGYVLIGTSDSSIYGYDASLIRLDGSGNLIWKSFIGGAEDETGYMVLQNREGGYVVVGSSNSTGTPYSKAFLIGTDSTGYSEWGSLYGNNSDCWAKAVQQTSDGGYILAGGKYDPVLGDCDAFLVKTDSLGHEQWNRTYGGYGDDWASSVLQTSDGGYLFTGTYTGPSGESDIYVKKVFSDGSTDWGNYYYTDWDVWGNSVMSSGDGGYVIAGGIRYNATETKIVLLKIQGNGDVSWTHYYGDASYQEGMSIRPTSDRGYLTGGTVYDDGNRSYRMELLKTDSAGNFLWNLTCPGTGNDYGYYAQQTSDNSFIVAGTIYVDNTTEAGLVKLNQGGAPQDHKPVQVVQAPPMVPGFSTTGGITGRVSTYNASFGIASTDVWIVNASNTSQYYWHTTTNAQGFFQLANVNNTWDGLTYRPRYRAYAYDNLLGEGYSNNFTVEMGSNAWTAVMLVTSSSPMPVPPYPAQIVQVVPAPPMQGPQVTGLVTGRVTTFNTTAGIADTFVAIVNASNTSQAFYVGLTDAQGYFHFAGVNHTYDSTAGTFVPSYKIYADNSLFGNGWSNNFTVEPLTGAWAAVIINPVPSHISLSSSRYILYADSTDQVTISACVTDFAGNMVADNTQITFTSNAGTSYIPGMGSWHGGLATNSTVVSTSGGYANVTFGLVDGAFAGDSLVIKAAWSHDDSVNASVLITFYAPTGIPTHRPIQQVTFPPQSTTPPMNGKGGITGRVTTFNTTMALANADVYIVNPNNLSQYYWHGQTNSQGFYQITDVNNTWDEAAGTYRLSYKAYSYDEMIGEGYSNNFTVEVGSNAWAAIIVNPQATTIGMSWDTVAANSMDYTPLSVRLTDFWGNAVVDNTPVTLWVDQSPWSDSRNGSFGHCSINDHLQSVTTSTVNGYANVSFGWVDSAYAGTSSRINISYGTNTGARCHSYVSFVPGSLVPTIGFALPETIAVAGGADATIAIRRYKNVTVPASVVVSIGGGTAILNIDYTVSPALPATVSFAAGEVEKTFTIHANPGSAGKTIILQLADFTNATSDNSYTSTVKIDRLIVRPFQQINFPSQTLTPGINQTGGISGRVTTFNTTIGIVNADLFLVNTFNTSQYYWHGHTNAQGFFYVTNINNTWSDSAGAYQLRYKMYCNDTLYGDGYSNNFTVESGSTAWAAVIINPVPAHMNVFSSRSYIVANSSDRALISAYVTDAMGNSVADNTPVTFTINPGTIYSAGRGNFTGCVGNTTTVGTLGGYANVTFGWVNGAYAGSSTVISAFFEKNRNVNATVSLSLLLVSSPPPSHGPIQQVSPYNMTPGVCNPGGITGRVTTVNTTIGIANTDVWIVNASNTSQYFWHTTTNAQGFYQLTNVNNTYVDATWFAVNPGKGGPFGYTVPGYYCMYKAYCYDNVFGESWSNNFSVEAGSTAWAAIIINPVPAHIKINLERDILFTNGTDRIKVSAYVTDALNNAVSDAPITFTINKGTAYSYGMGNWSGLAVNTTMVGTSNGYANVTFGWVPDGFTGNNSTLTAACANNPAVSDAARVFFQLHAPLPDAIVISANPDVIMAGDDTSLITAQLYLNGAPYHWANVPISFASTDDTIAFLPTVKTNLSDANGQATILLTSNRTKGNVTVWAFSQITVANNLTAHTDVEVVGWGTISGMVTDKNHNGVPNATVKLWRTRIDESGIWSTTLYPSPENPQQTVSNPDVAAVGMYTYPRVPSGMYNVTAEKTDALGNNHLWFAIVNLTVGTATNNIAIPDLDILVPTQIQIGVSRTNVAADGADSITVWAYATDALNNPVADNTPITFTINPGTTYSAGMGKWSGSTTNNTIISTVHGHANVTYGWVPEGNGGNTSTLRAVCLDDEGISATTVITFQSSGTPPGQGVPCVIRGIVTYNGAPVQGAQVVATPGGDTEISDANGNYSVDVPSGTIVSITASYNGSSATLSGINTPANGGFVNNQNISITSAQPFIINLCPGWNLISIPVNNNALRASDLVGNASLGVDMVSVYNNSTGGYTTYYIGAAAWKNVQLSPDRGYFVHGTRISSFPVDGSAIAPHNINIYRGWNLIGWTFTNVNASDILGRATISMVSRYNITTKSYQTYYAGASPVKNFTLRAGEGYFLRSDTSAVQHLLIG